MLSYEARISTNRVIATHYELWKWAGKKVMLLPETLADIPELPGKKRVDFLPLLAPMEEIKKPLTIITDYIIPLSPSCRALL